jgi:hypothetical protein
MSDLPLLISEYGLYLFIGIVLLTSIGVIAICSAEDCTCPAECFDCKDSTCLKCRDPHRKPRSDQWVWKPILEHGPMFTRSDTAEPGKPIALT